MSDLDDLLEGLDDSDISPEEALAFAEFVKGGLGSGSIVINGVLNLIGKWIDALGQAIQAATADSPAGIAAAAGFAALTAFSLSYLTTRQPFKLILQKTRFYDLVTALGSQIGGIVKDLNGFLTQPGSGASGPGKPDVQIPTIGPQGGTNQCPGDPNGKFGIQWTPQEWVQLFQSITGFPTAGSVQTFTTADCRDKVLAILQADTSKNWYWTFRAVNL